MDQIKSLVIIDYSCHPFSLDLANHLSKNKIRVYYYFSKFVNLTGDYFKIFKNKNLKIYPIDIGTIPKHNFLKRRFKEIKFGNKVINKINKIKPDKVLLANLPLDPLFRIIKFCNKNSIDNYFWIQDIYHLAIRNVLKKNILFYCLAGYFIYKFYSYIEKYCFIHSTKNIVITKKFLRFFPLKKKIFIINNWVPLDEINIIKKNKKIIPSLNKTFNFLYTGTFSYKHHSDILLKLAIKFKESKIIILSNDKFASDIIQEAKKKSINNIFLHKLISYQDLPYLIKKCDVGLVNLNYESNNVCVPSKILTYYKYGLPILASMPLNNPASLSIKKFKTGFVSNPSQIKQYLNNAYKLMNNSKLRSKFSKNGKIFANKNFNIKKISKKFIKILEL